MLLRRVRACYCGVMPKMSRKDLVLLVLLTLCWGLNWPVMKLGVNAYPPITFRVSNMIGALPLLWFVAHRKGVPLALSFKQIKSIFWLCLPNMLFFQLSMTLGIKILASSGRAAILCYTMPVWAVLSGLVFFRENLGLRAWLSVGCAVGGAVLLLSSEFASFSGQPLGTFIILAGAMAWGFGTVLLKRNTLELSALSITFWMMLISSVIMLLLAIVFERGQWRMPDPVEWGAILYNVFLVFGFAYVVWVQMASTLPPVASTLSVMMIPVLGLFSSMWVLGETPNWQDYAAMALILIAMGSVLLRPNLPADQASDDSEDVV